MYSTMTGLSLCQGLTETRLCESLRHNPWCVKKANKTLRLGLNAHYMEDPANKRLSVAPGDVWTLLHEPVVNGTTPGV